MDRKPVIACFLLLVAGVAGTGAQEATPKNPPPPPLTHYKGRLIATTMHYSGAPWLVREDREQQERCSLLLTNLGLKMGMTVCDLGCGNGFYTLQIARLIGPSGRVLAVDVQPEMLGLLKRRTAEEKLTNITPLLGLPQDPRLPKGEIDLILLVDVYHEFSHPEHMLVAMREALSPTGVIALVEFRAEDPKVPIKPEHKMSIEQIMQEFPPMGFAEVRRFDRLPWQHLLFFGRDDERR